jgi:hypothetical protein
MTWTRIGDFPGSRALVYWVHTGREEDLQNAAEPPVPDGLSLPDSVSIPVLPMRGTEGAQLEWQKPLVSDPAEGRSEGPEGAQCGYVAMHQETPDRTGWPALSRSGCWARF